MEAVSHQGRSLNYLSVHPNGYDPGAPYPAIILLHGIGAHMGDLAGLTPLINSTGYIYLCPNAPLAVQIGPGMIGFAWSLPSSVPPERVPSDLPDPEALLETFFQEVIEEYRIRPSQMVLLGFSQGGRLAYSCGLPNSDRFAGVVALSCALPNPEHLRPRLPAQRSQPVFIAHGTQDNPERARQAREFLEQEGYRPWYKEYPMGHEIGQDVIADLAPWVHQVLPPLLSNQS